MKSPFLLLLVSLVCSFHSYSQTHFITAGQTQGMIFTDYVPGEIFYWGHSLVEVDYFPIDLEHNGIPDVETQYYSSIHPGGGWVYLQVNPDIQNIQFFCKPDSGIGCYGNYKSIGVLLNFGDTITSSGGNWSDSSTLLIYESSDNCSYNGTGIRDSNYWAGRIINGIDTSLFYLHLLYNSVGNNGFLLDYAIEGQDTTIIINSTNDLSLDKSITTYPNPFTNQININYARPFDYQITDYVGRVVSAGKAERTINTNDLPAGNYLLLMKNEEFYSVKKILKAEN